MRDHLQSPKIAWGANTSQFAEIAEIFLLRLPPRGECLNRRWTSGILLALIPVQEVSAWG
jgi:hypothetical protein